MCPSFVGKASLVDVPRDRVVEFRQRINRHGGDVSSRVDHIISRVKATETSIENALGRRVENLDILDVGPGQNSSYMKLFAREQGDASNRVMDATAMTFPSESFDVVYSHSVFEHILDVRKGFEEVRRVLRPSGVAYLAIHLWTSDDGAHDPGILSGERRGLPGWPHLRKQYEAQVKSNAVLNRLRLAEYRQIAMEVFGPHTELVAQYDVEQRSKWLREARASNELEDYSDEELMTVDLVLIAKK